MATEGEGKNPVGGGGWDNLQQQATQATSGPTQVEVAQETIGQGMGQEPEGENTDREREGSKGVKDDDTHKDLVLVEDQAVVAIEDSEEDIYYDRKRKPSERNRSVFTPIATMYSSGHALPDANRNRSLVFDSMDEDWDYLRRRKVQLVNFLASLEHASGNSAIADKIEGGKLTNHSVDPTKQKEKGDIVLIDSDDEDRNSSEHNKLASGVNKDLTTFEEIASKSEGGKLTDHSK